VISEIGVFDYDHISNTLILSDRLREIHGMGPDEPATLERFLGKSPENRLVLGDGSIRWTKTRAETVFEGGHAVRTVGEVMDITRQKRAEEKVAELEQALAEKDVLLKEIHHRVNNNLAVIASLLRMQAEDVPDDHVANVLRESQSRVESMALIHGHLYNSADWSTVNFAEYTAVLAGNVFHAYGVDQSRISWRVDIPAFDLSVDKAIPAGLILNELISNALKHAFPNGRRGSILVEGRVHDGRIELAVQDDGEGVLKTSDPVGRKSLGLKIVGILCRQLKGTFVKPDSEEAIFRISFPYGTPARLYREKGA
jgi:two-component sensor histidine kinase